MRKLFVIFLALFSLAFFSSAEYEMRIWEDVNGNKFEGRFVRELFGKMTIEAADGTRQTFDYEDLTELDQRYLRVMVPPELEVVVNKTNKSIESRPVNNTRYKTQIEDYTLTVIITKKSQRPFTSRLQAEIFMIAEEVSHGEYVLMDRTVRDFIMPTITKGAEVELKSHRVRMRLAWASSGIKGGREGQEYKGYLVVISSMSGDIVHTETNLQKWIEDPKVIQNLRDLAITGAPSWLSRLFDKEGKKVPPPRPPLE